MKTRTAQQLFRISLAVVLSLVVLSLGAALWFLPPGDRKEGLKGVVFAVVVMGTGLTVIFRIGRAVEREEAEEEAREAREDSHETNP